MEPCNKIQDGNPPNDFKNMAMKNIRIISFKLLILMLVVVSCQDEEQELGEMLSPSQIDFDVMQDLETDPGGNTVILRNNTPGTIPVWDYGTGRSTRQTDTIRFAFRGEYVIQFSAVTAGGLVTLEPVTVVVTEDNLNYVNDPLWTLLTGGVGNEKTWLMDANENTESKFFTSPVYFAGMDNAYGTIAEDGQSVFWSKECLAPDGPNCWTYEPNYKADTWAAPAQDYGHMTFSLKGGPFVQTDHKGVAGIGTESGTFFLDVNTLMLTTTDATPLTVPYGPTDAVTLNSMRILSLTDNTMQLAFKNKAKDEYFVINYISKEYSDNWVPEETEDPNFDHGDQHEILAVTTSKIWKLDLEVPYNWTNLEGEFLNAWNSRADIMATDWNPPYGDADVQNIDEAAITFNADGSVVVAQDDGTTATGTYTIDEETNIVTFEGVTPSILIADWVSATTTDENQWKIVVVEKADLTGEVEGIWFGRRDPAKAEYMVFHFVQR